MPEPDWYAPYVGRLVGYVAADKGTFVPVVGRVGPFQPDAPDDCEVSVVGIMQAQLEAALGLLERSGDLAIIFRRPVALVDSASESEWLVSLFFGEGRSDEVPGQPWEWGSFLL